MPSEVEETRFTPQMPFLILIHRLNEKLSTRIGRDSKYETMQGKVTDLSATKLWVLFVRNTSDLLVLSKCRIWRR